ncbi:MAG: hypothetical protein IPQ13_08060 [Holophagaceae bacterium]|nr:hypothetical protein [Holophagaceae bacterium]
MRLMLQFGYGMMDLSKELLKAWGGGGVILSPRDLDGNQLLTFAKQVNKLPGAFCLLDPQHYNPSANHERLVAHDFWPASYNTGSFWSGNAHLEHLRNIKETNDQLGTPQIIAPGPLLKKGDSNWKGKLQTIVDGFEKIAPDREYYLTIALSEDRALSSNFIHELLDELEKVDAFGVYIVAEHPKNAYLVEDVDWIANLLDLIAGCRIQGKDVLLGYCNHQMLIAGCAGANHIASGTWLNVRAFTVGKFDQATDDDDSRKSTWYYVPQGLSEFKVKDLDLAHKRKILNAFKPDKKYGSHYADPIFLGPQPTTVSKERAAFAHYLQCLKFQSEGVQKATFPETVEAYEKDLKESEASLAKIHSLGIRAHYKDFEDIFNINRVALKGLVDTRGAILERKWSALMGGDEEKESA